MTLEDLAAVMLGHGENCSPHCKVCALADALEQAWAERDHMKKGCWDNLAACVDLHQQVDRVVADRNEHCALRIEQACRAEIAEAQIGTLQGQLRSAWSTNEQLRERVERAEAEIRFLYPQTVEMKRQRDTAEAELDEVKKAAEQRH